MTGVAPKRSGFLSNPIVTVVSVVVALALVVTVGITAKNKFLPDNSITDTSKALPVDFPSSLTPVDSPLVQRAEKVTFQIQAPTGVPVKKVEVWDDGRLYLSWTPEKEDKPKGAPVFDVESTQFDYVPTTAGQHVLTTRLITTDGKISVAAPFIVPALDRTEDLYEKPPTLFVDGVEAPTSERLKRATVTPSVGETPKELAQRLGIATKELTPAPTSKTLSLPYASGTEVGYKFPSAAAAKKKLDARPLGKLADRAGITATVKDCIATVTLKDSVGDGKVALFATTPLKPGYLQIGTLEKGEPFKTSGLPIGKTSLMAYSSELGLTAAIPVSITIPEECSALGWKGDAKIVNGLLVTKNPIVRPYAYVSVDRGEWQRYPAGQGNYLQSGSINSVAAYMSTTKWDQLDVRVWSFDGSYAAQAASGTFCRKDMPNPDPWSGSNSKTGCRAVGPLPQDNTVNATKGSLSIKASLGDLGDVGNAISAGVDSVPGFSDVAGYSAEPIADDPSVTQTVQLVSDIPVTIEAAASNQIKGIRYQFSLFPISPNTTSLHPPGVFFVSEQKGTKAKFNPYKWRDAKLPGSDGDTQGLSFDDALALELAKANLEIDNNLLSSIYVRAVATDNQCIDQCFDNGDTGQGYSIGIASNSIKIDMSDKKKWTQLKPTATIKPGIDTDFQKDAARGKCFTILDYPDASLYRMFPMSAPYVEKPVSQQIFGEPKVKTKIVKNDSWMINPSVSDRAIAVKTWGEETNVVHCLDPDADKILSESAAAAKAKKEAECGFGCQATAILFGFSIGFVLGGPAGAVIGAAAGYYFAGDLKGVTGALNDLLLTYYGLIASFYNLVRTEIVNTIAQIVCVGIRKAGSEDGYDACATVVTVVVQAVITYYTGMPPTLPTSSALRALAKGEAQAWIAVAIEAAMRQVPAIAAACDAATLDEETVDAMSAAGGLADGLGANGVQKLVDDARRSEAEGGGISACNMVARAIAEALVDELDTFYSGQVGSAMELPYGLPPGVASEPVTDTTPEIVIEAPSTLFSSFQTCPVTANVSALLDGGVKDDKVLYTLRPLRSTLEVVPGAKKVRASFRLPVLPDTRTFPASLQTVAPTYPKDTPKYLTAQVNSPCFKDTNLVFEFDKKGGASPAFVDDDRPRDFYYTVVK